MAKGTKNYSLDGNWVVYALFKRNGCPFWHAKARNRITGQRRQCNLKTTSRTLAVQNRASFVEELKREENKKILKVSFADAAKDFVSVKPWSSEVTRREYRIIFTGVFVPAFKGLSTDQVAVRHVEGLFSKLQKERKLQRSTLKRYLAMLRCFFRWARERRYADEDPTRTLKYSKARPTVQKTVLDDEDARKLLKACKRTSGGGPGNHHRIPLSAGGTLDYLWLAVLIALKTGLRRKNVLGLRWDQVDLGKGTISIPDDQMKSRNPLSIPIADELLHVLRGISRQNDFVLGSEFTDLYAGFKSALARAGLPSMRFHDLRTTVATWLVSTTSEPVRKAILGHSFNTDITLSYTVVSMDVMRKAIDGLPRLLD